MRQVCLQALCTAVLTLSARVGTFAEVGSARPLPRPHVHRDDSDGRRPTARPDLLLRVGPAAAPEAGSPQNPGRATEDQLVERIEKLSTSLRGGLPLQARVTLNAGQLREIILTVDELLRRYPTSSHKDKAIATKLAALAELARARPRYLEQLISFTDEIAEGNPQGWLASENTFYAIQAFVLGARYEDMPDERRLRGTIERYEAFLEDHPASSRRPVIWASLIRNLVAAGRIEHARDQWSKLRAQYPNHAATRRA